LERKLENIPNKTAYDLANAVDNTYVEIEKLRLLFLRAESFDPRLAAYRMVSFWYKSMPCLDEPS
jgi:hypothetical protein